MSLYIFNKDGTLVSLVPHYMVLLRPALRPEEQVLRPGVFEKLAGLRAAGHVLAIAANMNAVAKGSISLEQAGALMVNCGVKLGGINGWRVCPFDPMAPDFVNGRPNPYAHDDETRKPKPGMFLELMSELGYAPRDTIVVGDYFVDRKAARAAGTAFIRAADFFERREV